jgi:hypothetical protein
MFHLSFNISPITGLDKGLLEAAFYLQVTVGGKGYDNLGLLRPIGQDLGGFQHSKRGGRSFFSQGYRPIRRLLSAYMLQYTNFIWE